MNILKNMGGRLVGAIIVIGVVSGGIWIFDRFDGNSDTGSMKPGECILMTDGPARGSGSDGGVEAVDPSVEDEYPTVDCDKWAEEAEPWKVYRVEWVKEAGGDDGTISEIENSCNDIYIVSNGKSVTCFVNVEEENGAA